MIPKTAVLLINLGTPNALNKKAIKSYLREFLLDARVVDIPWLLRYVLVNLIIVPFRSKNTLEAYSEIWTNEGSPLLVNSQKLLKKLQKNLNLQQNELHTDSTTQYDVFLAMRYGAPSIESVLAHLQQNNYTRITIVPLYPQYASASTGSVLEKCLKHLSDFGYFPKINSLNEFYNEDGYIKSLANSIKPYLDNHINNNVLDPEHHLLFSYHGIPKKQLALSKQKNSACENNQACPAKNYPAGCYRAQCYATTRLIADQLNLDTTQFSTSFQSRLGKLPWIKPYTDELLTELRERNITKLTVACPSFVSDCLETIEEIGIRLKEDWLKLGGTEFNLVPCLNDNDDWVIALADIIKKEG